MWIVIGAVAIIALGLAAFAGLGKFGEMPATAVTDRPKGFIPDGPVTAELLAALQLPTASSGYDKAEVDAYLASIPTGQAAPASETFFTVGRKGYDMQAVDELIERPRYERPTAAPAVDEGDESVIDKGSDVEVIELGEEADDADLTPADVGNEPQPPTRLLDAE
ncbi:MAG TPA: hypothetical protein K8V15_09985 [Tessaracoccus flavescens]|uniref:DivIVA domain-containing protein n=1 Tax=Tessaracoccus flavescens TaxID=399497 RepID=A0A921JRL0_9ACTN|nr:hypothetical protein [Tessaracoccus flavescens]